MKRNKLGMMAAALCMLMLILDSRAAAEAAASGVEACIRTVIPALFPFFMLSGYLTGSMESGKLSTFLGRMFGVSENCGGIILAGFLGGYPLGAKLASEGCRHEQISKAQADRLLMFCSQAGPAFLFGIAAAQLGVGTAGWMLWAVQLLSALAVAWIFPLKKDKKSVPERKRTVRWNEIMQSSLLAMGSVCGWVVAFSVIIRFVRRWILWLLPETAQILICGLLELTNGCLMLSSVENPQLRFILAVVFLNFGGLCVVMQTASVARELDLKRYLLGKITQTVCSLLICLAFLGHYVCLIPLILVYSIKNSVFFGKGGRNLRRVGV